MSRSDQEEPGLCAMCYLSWCKSPKTWCRFLCFLATLVHGCFYAVLSCLLVLDLRPSHYFPLLEAIRTRVLTSSLVAPAAMETYITCLLIVSNFLLALPYLAVAAVGSRNVALLFFTFVVCTVELLAWLAILVLAVVATSYVTSDLRVILQWVLLSAMISLLFMCWTLLLMTWKGRRHDQMVALHTARLVSARKVRKKSSRAAIQNDAVVVEARV